MFSPLVTLTLALSLLAQGTIGAHAVAESTTVVTAGEMRHVGATPPPHGYPEIHGVQISSTNIRAGSRVTGSVVTSENVGYVEARIDNYNVALHADGPGRFSLAYTVPWWLPPWLRKAYNLQIIARSIDGVEAIQSIGIRVR